MKAILLATAVSAVYLIVATVAFRLSPRAGLRARFMLWLFILTLPFAISLHYVTPADLGFIPAPWYENNHVIDLLYFLFLYAAAFFGGILQLYNLADRGFSLRILIDITEAAPAALAPVEVMRIYSAGKGIAWMYDKRLADLDRLQLIAVDNGVVSVTPKGRSVAARFAYLRRMLRLGD